MLTHHTTSPPARRACVSRSRVHSRRRMMFRCAGYTRSGTARAGGEVTHPLQWSSEVHAPGLALVYYNPADGRWTRRDPIGIKGGMNLYGFVKNCAFCGDWLGYLAMYIYDSTKIDEYIMSIFWTMELRKRAPEDAYFVQEIKYTYKSKKCSNPPDRISKSEHYWEVWPIKRGKKYATPKTGDDNVTYNDWWRISEPSPCSQGEVTIISLLKVFSKRITGDLGNPVYPDYTGNAPFYDDTNTVWKSSDHNKMSHSAPSTNTRPSWWDQKSSFSENSISHEAEIVWDYCYEEKRYVKLDNKIFQGTFFIKPEL